MNEARRIVLLLLYLAADILRLACRTVKQVILPGRRSKGNLLSSVLCFFIALLEKLVLFEKNLFRRSFICRYKYVRQALLLVTAFLFLLSSLEWTISPAAARVNPPVPVTVAPQSAAPGKRLYAAARHIPAGTASRPAGRVAFSSHTPPAAVVAAPVVLNRYLLYCTLRI